MRNLKSFEALAVFSDPLYGNDAFKVRYKPLDTLSNKKSSDISKKPHNDVLDDYQEGDIVKGIGMTDEEAHIGSIVNIKKDENGENVEISIEEDGVIIKLVPSSVEFDNSGNRGNSQIEPESDYSTQPQMVPVDSSNPFVYESSFKNLKRFSEFNGDTNG